METFAGQPFQLLGINSDTDRSFAARERDALSVTWPLLFDGGTNGPVHREWSIQSWPTVYLIDRDGILRERHTGRVARELLTESIARWIEG